jgi:hypothetical protein
VSKRLAGFLPFCRVEIKKQEDVSVKDDADAADRPVKSLEPLQVEDELPNLSVFATLQPKLTPGPFMAVSTPDAPFLDIQNLYLSSPDGLFHATLELTTDTETGRVERLELKELSTWAEAELRKWVREVAKTGNIVAVSRACSKYWDVVKARARCWSRCARLKNAKLAASNGDMVDTAELDDEAPLRRSVLLAHLDRQHVFFTDNTVSLLVQWRISFKPTGEPCSHVSALASYPKAWRDSDERGSLGKIGETFELLMRKRGVYEATRIMSRLLFGNE